MRMKKKVFGFFFSSLLLPFFFSLNSVKPVFAARCEFVVAVNVPNDDSISGVVLPNQRVIFNANLIKDPSEVVEKRVIYDGYQWMDARSTSSTAQEDYIELDGNTTYSELRDYPIAAAWKIQGQSNYVYCYGYARVFERRAGQNKGSLTLTYPTGQTSLAIGDYGRYIGTILKPHTSSQPWVGNHFGFSPNPSSVDNDWFVRERGNPSSNWMAAGAFWKSGSWESQTQSIPYGSLYNVRYNQSTTSITVDLARPSFPVITDPAKYPYSTFYLNDLVIYSRPEQGCAPGCPRPTWPTPRPPSPVPTTTSTAQISSPAVSGLGLKVFGYIRNIYNQPLTSARVLVHKTDSKYGPCSGQHWGCNPEYVTTDSNGYWSTICTINSGVKSILVKEVSNSTLYVDSSRNPDPAGGSIWDVNTVCRGNLSGLTGFGPVVFYDSK